MILLRLAASPVIEWAISYDRDLVDDPRESQMPLQNKILRQSYLRRVRNITRLKIPMSPLVVEMISNIRVNRSLFVWHCHRQTTVVHKLRAARKEYPKFGCQFKTD